jgi:hypothetical protein
MQPRHDHPAAREHQSGGDDYTGGDDQERGRVVPQVRRGHNERAAEHERRAVESVDGLLVEVDGYREGTAERSEREFKTLPPYANPGGCGNPRERAKECERIAPSRNRGVAVRARHTIDRHVEGLHEVMVVQQHRRGDTGEDHSSRGYQW